MFKLLLIIFVLLSNSAQSKLSLTEKEDILLAELSTTREIIRQERLDWENKFYDHLIRDNDPNINIIGYKKKLRLLRTTGDKSDFIEIATNINEILILEQLTPKSLKNIETICSYTGTEQFCDHGLIFEKQFKSIPKNAFIYLNGLYDAKQDNNFDEVEKIIKELADSNYIDVYNFPDPEYREKLENYVKEHPFSKNKLELEKLWITRSSLSSEDKQAISENMKNIMIMIFININRMSDSIPSYRTLIEVCRDNPKLETSCLQIAETFINHSKAVISKHIGYTIKAEILKQKKLPEKQKIVDENKKNFKNNFECFSKIMHYGTSSYYINGPKYTVIAEPIEREFGEVAFFKAIAELNYEYYSSQGDKDIMNPDNCDNSTNKQAIELWKNS